MQVDYKDLDVLLEIQGIDVAIIQLKKARAELPQRIEVMKVRKKHDEIAPKLDQVIEMQTAKEADITRLEDEDRMLEERRDRAQADIDAGNANYRVIEAHTKEMADIEKRRGELAGRLAQLADELDKVKGVRVQVENALALCDKREAELRSSLESEDDDLVARVRKLQEERGKLMEGVPAQLKALYEKTAAKAGSVALGKLEEDRCGVCRMPIESGRLIELRSQAPLGMCPNCKRLLVIE